MHSSDYVECHFDQCLAVALVVVEEHGCLVVEECGHFLVVMEEHGCLAAEHSNDITKYCQTVYCIAQKNGRGKH